MKVTVIVGETSRSLDVPDDLLTAKHNVDSLQDWTQHCVATAFVTAYRDECARLVANAVAARLTEVTEL